MAVAAPLLIPALEALGTTVGPYLAELLGEKAVKSLTPLAKSAITKLIHSGVLEKGMHKIGNKIFSKNKTARSLFNKGRKLSSHIFSEKGSKILGQGLDLASDIGLLSPEKHNAINEGYRKAMSFHDKLSSINVPKSKVM